MVISAPAVGRKISGISSACTMLDVAGVTVSNSTFNSLVQRYSNRDGKIYFDGYIHCIARLCTMFGMQLHCLKKRPSHYRL